MVTLVVCCPSDPLQLSECWGNHYIGEVGSANRWDALKTATPAAGIGQQNGPSSSPGQVLDHTFQNQCLRSWMNCATKFHLTRHFAWHIADRLPLLQASWKLSAGIMLPQPLGGRKCFPRVHQIVKHGFLFFIFIFFALFHVGKVCWLWWFLFWLIMMCLSLVIVI